MTVAGHAGASPGKPGKPGKPTKPAKPAKPVDDATIAVAKRLYLEGARAYREGDYDRALSALRRSYRLVPRSKTLLNIAAVLIDKGDIAVAANTLQEYLERDAGVRSDDAMRARARATLAKLDARLGRIQYHVSVPATLVMDAWSVSTPKDGARRVLPGAHEIVLRDARGVVLLRRSWTASAGQTFLFEFVGPSPTVAPPAFVHERRARPRERSRARDKGRSLLRSPALWLGLGSVALGATGLGFGASSWRKLDALDRQLADPSTRDMARLRQLEDDARTRARIANVSFAAAGVSLVGAIVVYLVTGRDEVQPGPDGTLGVAARF